MRKNTDQKIKIGILGCGAIGAGIARYIVNHFKSQASLVAICDHHSDKIHALCQELNTPGIFALTEDDVIARSDLVVEAISSKDTKKIIKRILVGNRDVLVMSVGKLLAAPGLFKLAAEKKLSLLLPSGAIAGIDAIKAGSLIGVKTISLTTRKPIQGFLNDPYLKKQGIDLSRVKTERVIFEGNVREAVKAFPRNINVAATLALAANAQKTLTVRIIASANVKRNTHQIEMEGAFGKITTITENVISPDNPKTSYLAVLSAVQTLKQYLTRINIGT